MGNQLLSCVFVELGRMNYTEIKEWSWILILVESRVLSGSQLSSQDHPLLLNMKQKIIAQKAQRQYHMTFLALKLVLLARELKQLCCYFTYSSGTNMFFSFGRKELQLLYWRLLMSKEEHLHGSEGLYGITWRRSMVLVLLFLTCLCVLVCQRLA